LGNLPAQSSRKRSAIKPNDNARLKFKHNTDAYKNSPLNTSIVNDAFRQYFAGK